MKRERNTEFNNPYEVGREFAELFSRFEHALKRAGFLKKRADAQADWNKFARQLGDEFFRRVKDAGFAGTLIGNPPRKLMADGLKWGPTDAKPITDVIELFALGVCRVRNSFIHGEKFVRGLDARQRERDAILVSEALKVLREARDWAPEVAALLDGSKLQGS